MLCLTPGIFLRKPKLFLSRKRGSKRGGKREAPFGRGSRAFPVARRSKPNLEEKQPSKGKADAAKGEKENTTLALGYEEREPSKHRPLIAKERRQSQGKGEEKKPESRIRLRQYSRRKSQGREKVTKNAHYSQRGKPKKRGRPERVVQQRIIAPV